MGEDICNSIVKKEILNLRNCQYLLVRIANCNLKVGDICKDDLGNVFTVKAWVHYKFSGEIPEWYFKTPEYQLEGKSNDIGNYLTKIVMD